MDHKYICIPYHLPNTQLTPFPMEDSLFIMLIHYKHSMDT